jgi:AcrR family transcriptional regulator
MPKHQTKAIRRAQIIEAAGKLITSYGSENLTVKSIADEVGISDAAIYRHFRNKKEVLTLLADHVKQTLVGDVESVHHRIDSKELLQESVIRHISLIKRRRGISFQIISEIISLGDHELNTHAYEALNSYTEKLALMLKQAAGNQRVKADIDFQTLALSISCIIQGLVNMWVLSNYESDLKAEFIAIWGMLLKGLPGLN